MAAQKGFPMYTVQLWLSQLLYLWHIPQHWQPPYSDTGNNSIYITAIHQLSLQRRNVYGITLTLTNTFTLPSSFTLTTTLLRYGEQPHPYCGISSSLSWGTQYTKYNLDCDNYLSSDNYPTLIWEATPAVIWQYFNSDLGDPLCTL